MATKVKKKKKKTSTSRLAEAEAHITTVAKSFKHLRLLIYAKAKRGKTGLACTAPKPMLIDCHDEGTLSVRLIPGVKVFHAEKADDIDLAYWYLKRHNHDRETVILDHMTGLAQIAMRKVLGREEAEEEGEAITVDMPSKRHYGEAADMVKDWIWKFRGLPMHVIFLAQEKRGFSEEDDEETTEVFPDVSPSIRNALIPAVDIIGRLFIKEVVVKKGGKRTRKWQRRLLIGEDESYTTGDRSHPLIFKNGELTAGPGLPRVIKDPTVPKILRAIRGEE